MPDTTARLLQLLSLLQNGREWTGAELADRTGCNVRTIRRDMDRLRAMDYPIHARRGSAGYRLDAGSHIPPLSLDDDEAVAIVIGLRTAAARHVTGLEEAADRALTKLERLLPSRLAHRVTALESVDVSSTSVGSTVDPELITLLAGACRDQRTFRFDYTDFNGTSTRRTVEPHRLVHTGRRWYLVAYDLDRDDWRSFRVDRLHVSHPGHAGAPFIPRPIPGGDAVAFVTRGVAGRLWQHRALVRLHAPAADVADLLPPSTEALIAVDKASCLLDVGGNHPDRLAADLCSLPVDFDVIDGPEGLAAALSAIAQRLQRHL